MPEIYVNEHGEIRHSEEIQDIITKVPSWILRWGITILLCVILLMVGLSAFIRYPDVIHTQLKISADNAAKPIEAKLTGKLVRILIADQADVKINQPLGFLESTANHQVVIDLSEKLIKLQMDLNTDNNIFKSPNWKIEKQSSLGELQSSYQTFVQEYLNYKSVSKGGVLLRQRNYLQNDLTQLEQQKNELGNQKKIEQRDYELADQEYEMHKKLYEQKVETSAEFRQAESKFLSKKSPVIQTEAAIITARINYGAKQNDIAQLDNQITQQKIKFSEALNSLIAEIDEWKNKYILAATATGKVTFAGILQDNMILRQGQEVFYVSPINEHFFGDMSIPQSSMGKVKKGQEVLIKLKGFPYEQFGILHGCINRLADVPFKDSIFIAKVKVEPSYQTDMKHHVTLKQGMQADAEIITEDATFLERISWNIRKLFYR